MARTANPPPGFPWEDAPGSGEDEDVFDGSLLEVGRRALPFTYVHDWVTLSPASPAARCLYNILRMFVYDKSGTMTCGPRQEELAMMMGLSEASKVGRYLRELEAMEAVNTVRWGNPARNKYIVHETPPDGYTGPVSVAQWRAMFAEERARRKAVAKSRNKVKKARLRAKPPAAQEQLPLGEQA